ncbi:hypothetical protein BHYA_0070g00200 [Botrytis hyacinthi]|uniref:BZIP domain-containing protein n=1 Tax=Botrytis hyacinthi TaxID=278943 RepID=A0A4Z1GUI8_9HELO|nr:hypothetical protein BHYA_0070g00200 [Botrytis hyacinthi]
MSAPIQRNEIWPVPNSGPTPSSENEEDWTQIAEPRMRKRVQNRLSQRKHRQKSRADFNAIQHENFWKQQAPLETLSPPGLYPLSNNSTPPQFDYDISSPSSYRPASSLETCWDDTIQVESIPQEIFDDSYDDFHTSFPHASSLLEAGNCIPHSNNSGSRTIDPLVDLVSQQQPLPEIKRCISRYTTPHDWELADLNNIYSTDTANAPTYRVTASPTPPEPDLQSPSWQLDDIPAAQNGIILPPQLPRKNELQHSTCSLCGCHEITPLNKTHNFITTSNRVQLRPTILQHSGSELLPSSSPVHSHALPSTLASSSATIDTFLTDGLPLDLAGYSLVLVKKPNTTS